MSVVRMLLMRTLKNSNNNKNRELTMTYPKNTQPYFSTVQMTVKMQALLLMTYMLLVLGSSPFAQQDGNPETSSPTSSPTETPTAKPEDPCFGRNCNDPAESGAFKYFFVPVFLCLFCVIPSAVALKHGIEKLSNKLIQCYYGDQRSGNQDGPGIDGTGNNVEGRDNEAGHLELVIR